MEVSTARPAAIAEAEAAELADIVAALVREYDGVTYRVKVMDDEGQIVFQPPDASELPARLER